VSDELLEANAKFYECLEARDLSALAAVLAHSERQTCIHPGQEPVVGLSPVLSSWEKVFTGAEYLQFFITDAAVLASAADLGVVMCRENLLGRDRGAGTGIRPGHVVGTNVFVRNDGGWRLLVHQGSVIWPDWSSR
jgi:ketosteroid isomerase-like protein